MYTMQPCMARKLPVHNTHLSPQTTGYHRMRRTMLLGINCSSTLRRSPAPTREPHTTQRRFLPHKTSTNNKTHSFLLVTRAGHQQPYAVPAVDATEPTEQPVVQAQQSPGSTEARTGNKPKLANKATPSNMPTVRQRTSTPTKKRKRTAGTKDKRTKKKVVEVYCQGVQLGA